MTPDQVAASYDRIAQRWADAGFNRSNGLRQHELALRYVTSRGTALDIGCGCSGRIIDWLVSLGFRTEGLDWSSEMLRLARERHPGLRFHHADVCAWELPGRFDFISAWDSIWHVPLAQQETLLLKLLAGLNVGGVIIFTAGGTAEAEERRDEAMGVPMYHATLGVRRIIELIHQAGCRLCHFEYDQHPELHVYFVVQRPQNE